MPIVTRDNKIVYGRNEQVPRKIKPQADKTAQQQSRPQQHGDDDTDPYKAIFGTLNTNDWKNIAMAIIFIFSLGWWLYSRSVVNARLQPLMSYERSMELSLLLKQHTYNIISSNTTDNTDNNTSIYTPLGDIPYTKSDEHSTDDFTRFVSTICSNTQTITDDDDNISSFSAVPGSVVKVKYELRLRSANNRKSESNDISHPTTTTEPVTTGESGTIEAVVTETTAEVTAEVKADTDDNKADTAVQVAEVKVDDTPADTTKGNGIQTDTTTTATSLSSSSSSSLSSSTANLLASGDGITFPLKETHDAIRYGSTLPILHLVTPYMCPGKRHTFIFDHHKQQQHDGVNSHVASTDDVTATATAGTIGTTGTSATTEEGDNTTTLQTDQQGQTNEATTTTILLSNDVLSSLFPTFTTTTRDDSDRIVTKSTLQLPITAVIEVLSISSPPVPPSTSFVGQCYTYIKTTSPAVFVLVIFIIRGLSIIVQKLTRQKLATVRRANALTTATATATTTTADVAHPKNE